MKATDPRPHRMTVVLDGDVVRLRLVCPGEGHCDSYMGCGHCEGLGYTHHDDDEEVECKACEGRGHDWETCNLSQWMNDIQPEETYDGPVIDLSLLALPAPIEVDWDWDELAWRFTDNVPSLRELVFQAAGAATRPLLEDHPDYVFPSERVKDAVEHVLREFGTTPEPT